MGALTVEEAPDWGSLFSEPAWNTLLGSSATDAPFLTWQFQTIWWDALGEGRLRVLGVRAATGEWTGALPLYETRGPEGGRLALVGGADVADYLDVIARAGHEKAVWQALLGSLGDSAWSRLDLRPVPAASPTLGVLPPLAAAAGLRCAVERDERCPVIELAPSWDAYLAGLGGKDRHELRRKMRRVEGATPRIEVARSPAAIAALMDSFLALHRKSKVGKARFMDDRMEAFFRRLAVAMAAAGWAALWLLWLDGHPAAALFCLEYGGTIGLYNSGFDPEARAWSPGVVLIAHTIQDAIARGFRRYDFLRGDEPYKYGFGAVPTDVFRLTLTPARG